MKSKYWLAINYNYDYDANNDFLEEKGIKDYNQDVYEFYFENKDDDCDNFYKLLTQKEYEKLEQKVFELCEKDEDLWNSIDFNIIKNIEKALD